MLFIIFSPPPGSSFVAGLSEKQVINLVCPNYAQLAIVFGCIKFHDYIYGLPNVHIETNHKPLESILQSPFTKHPCTRLQRMIMSIQKYSITVEYKLGKQVLIANTLSRALLTEKANELEYKQYDINALHMLPICETKLDLIKKKTEEDGTLTELMTTVKNGWPSKQTLLPVLNRIGTIAMKSLTTVVLFKGEKVIIPTSMRPEMLKNIHISHLGIEKCKLRARDILYWPGMTAQIEDVVLNSTICSQYQKGNTKEPLLSHNSAHRPWAKVGAELCELDGRTYLVLVDYYSNFIEVDDLKATTGAKVITRCKSQFACHSIPDIYFTDNGPQFSSQILREFASS